MKSYQDTKDWDPKMNKKHPSFHSLVAGREEVITAAGTWHSGLQLVMLAAHTGAGPSPGRLCF